MLRFDGYDLCHNPEEVIQASGYDRRADSGHPPPLFSARTAQASPLRGTRSPPIFIASAGRFWRSLNDF